MTPLRAILENKPKRKAAVKAGQAVLIVGSPNVGKSALFNRLTGRYVTVSNYPGTTVEISRGRSRRLDNMEVIDTPGMYSLVPVSQEEAVARDMLLEASPAAVLHIIDAKNIQRMLGLTLQLIDAHLSVILVLNMIDEAGDLGIAINTAKLSQLLGVPVVATVATSGKGIGELIHAIRRKAANPVESTPTKLSPEQLDHQGQYDLAIALKARVDEIVRDAVEFPQNEHRGWRENFSRLCMNPWTGLPLLAAVLYFGIYQFVGKIGAGVCVDFLEHKVFQEWLSPWANNLANAFMSPTFAGLFTGEYGMITLGLRYAVAIILPVVGTFFLAFSILEDSGYLPRLAMLLDRVFKKIGLNGRAVIPMVLGFGCDTMATVVTRTLETRRERVIATLLLALAIPCSAQMGLMLALLALKPLAMIVWAVTITAVFLIVGALAAKMMPGDKPTFYMELPPLRLPRLANVMVKTYTRIVWYFKEILPMFILASLLIWLGNITGAFGWLVGAMQPVVASLGLPSEAAVSFLFGFFRRDYGAAGLYDLQHQGLLSGNQLAVAAITLTLFLPCVAQFLVMKKEQGWKVTLAIALFICMVAYGVGFAINAGLNLLGVQL